jgi:hypothetical protein
MISSLGGMSLDVCAFRESKNKSLHLALKKKQGQQMPPAVVKDSDFPSH